ncbi:hypothetical protein D5F51_20485 [Yersinia hibernica]|uniref:Uncharacterized protein n=1 Tax=Yersinia hibernica TaxID=2339259 RepID=A0ABX5R4W6_9GAMM|nr:hypothetical protein D5F51_20485 [Yersinia hibernica]
MALKPFILSWQKVSLTLEMALKIKDFLTNFTINNKKPTLRLGPVFVCNQSVIQIIYYSNKL